MPGQHYRRYSNIGKSTAGGKRIAGRAGEKRIAGRAGGKRIAGRAGGKRIAGRAGGKRSRRKKEQEEKGTGGKGAGEMYHIHTTNIQLKYKGVYMVNIQKCIMNI